VTWTIGLLGDVMLGRGVAKRLASVNPEEVWSPELVAITSSLDLLVCNLECCISSRGRPTDLIRNKRFYFRAPESAVASLGAVGVDAVGLANNHALDFGAEALSDTIRHLGEAGISATGAGLGPEEARRGVVVEGPGFRLGIVAVSDHPRQFAARAGSWGTSYAELERAPDWLLGEVRRLREMSDVVLAFPHWGPNMTLCPDRWQRRRAAELLDAGADAVAGHSAHVFHGIELLAGGPILYDLGDALDDYAVDRELRNDLGILVIWRPSGRPLLELVGLALDHCHTRVAAKAEADWIAGRLARACDELGTAVERTGEARFVIDL
jgi:poly-gamma-glutamate synthesis protein (capsule biosynthesis protein)